MFTNILRGLAGPQISKLSGLIMLAVMAMLLGAPGRAQVSTASLNGTVTDNTGALIQGARVVVIQTQTNLTTETVSGPDGSFRVTSIPVGSYVIRVSKDGFSKYEQSGIVLTVGQVATLPIALTVGSATQDVVVTAEVPAVESTNNTIQTVVEVGARSILLPNPEQIRSTDRFSSSFGMAFLTRRIALRPFPTP